MGYDNALGNIWSRLTREEPCKTNTGKEGMMTSIDNCDSAKESIKNGETNPRLCDYKFCDTNVCCPIPNNGIIYRRSLIDFSYNYASINAGSCTDEITGEDGICTLPSRCELSFDRNFTVCGNDQCNLYICCPFRKFNSKSLQGKRKCYKVCNNILNIPINFSV